MDTNRAWRIQAGHVEQSAWNRLAAGFLDYTLYQSWDYAHVAAEAEGAECIPTVIVDEQEPRALAMVRVKRVPGLRLGIAYVSGGPMWYRDEPTSDSLRLTLDCLRQHLVVRQRLLLRVAPNGFCEELRAATVSATANAGFHESPQSHGSRTVVLDLRTGEDSLRKELHKTWRKHLNRAERTGLEVRVSTDDHSFGELAGMYGPMRLSKGFTSRLDVDVLRKVQSALPEPMKLRVVMAYKDGRAVSGHATSHLGRTGESVLAATTEEGYDCDAGYSVWWHTLLLARREGMWYYDTGGVDAVRNPGGYQFKKGLGGVECDVLSSFDATPGSLAKVTLSVMEGIYRKGAAAFQRISDHLHI